MVWPGSKQSAGDTLGLVSLWCVQSTWDVKWPQQPGNCFGNQHASVTIEPPPQCGKDRSTVSFTVMNKTHTVRKASSGNVLILQSLLRQHFLLIVVLLQHDNTAYH